MHRVRPPAACVCHLQPSPPDPLLLPANLARVASALQLPGGTFAALGDYTALMRRCWAEQPGERPSFDQVELGWREGWPVV